MYSSTSFRRHLEPYFKEEIIGDVHLSFDFKRTNSLQKRPLAVNDNFKTAKSFEKQPAEDDDNFKITNCIQKQSKVKNQSSTVSQPVTTPKESPPKVTLESHSVQVPKQSDFHPRVNISSQKSQLFQQHNDAFLTILFYLI